LLEHFRLNIDDCIIHPNGVVDNLIPKSRITLTKPVDGKIPVKFGSLKSHFYCEKKGLDTLENCPNIRVRNLMCSGNNLTSLEHAPLEIQDHLHCVDNPFKTLKGIEINSSINRITITYDSNIPLLRLLVARSHISFGSNVPDKNFYQPVEEILNEHISSYSNLKERLVKCQYALIKAGFKTNAKW
jgi:hypothetical protein